LATDKSLKIFWSKCEGAGAGPVYSEVKIREAIFWQVICSQTGARTEGPNFKCTG
jgi:hypothetical protein